MEGQTDWFSDSLWLFQMDALCYVWHGKLIPTLWEIADGIHKKVSDPAISLLSAVTSCHLPTGCCTCLVLISFPSLHPSSARLSQKKEIGFFCFRLVLALSNSSLQGYVKSWMWFFLLLERWEIHMLGSWRQHVLKKSYTIPSRPPFAPVT